jgi:biotin carboxyl carrier protein
MAGRRRPTQPADQEIYTENRMSTPLLVVVPELGLPGIPLRASVWHVAPGERLNQGDRLVELVADGVLIDIPAPAAGLLVRQLIAEDDLVGVGEAVAILDLDAAEGAGQTGPHDPAGW